jgi:hypothetical protein
MNLKIILNFVAAVFSVFAAGFWFYSTIVKVNGEDANGIMNAPMIVETKHGDVDFVGTAIAQATWGKWAAVFASIGAFCQGIALLL